MSGSSSTDLGRGRSEGEPALPRGAGVLERGAEVPDGPGLLLGPALGVERDEPVEDGGAEGGGLGVEVAPAVGVEDGPVEPAVEVEERVGEAVVGGPLLLGREVAAEAEGLDGVVEVGQAEAAVFGLAGLPVGVDGLAELADVFGLFVRRGGEGEGLKALVVLYTRIVAYPSRPPAASAHSMCT